ncbi:TPA: hypothetical protein HA251_07530 [Candidatus Woesearchaeota archaeon]|nr:hypothetical protein [Candidatus Woesearchaeota archaeon]
MTGKVLIPPAYDESLQGPLIFLVGPIQGARRWQDDAIGIIHRIAPEFNIANPRRPDASYSHGDFSDELYNEQVDWETRHLRRAGQHGGVLVWCAAESHHLCERAYAQTSRFEIGEWKERTMRDGNVMVLGIEDGFTGAKYYRRRFSQDCPNVPLCDNLENACERIVDEIRMRQRNIEGVTYRG